MRRILLGVTGSIAAYKAVELVRLFVKNGDTVNVMMTPAACEFVKPLTFQTLSRNPVYIDQFAPPVSWEPEHISLAESADLVLVAPATAKRAPIAVAPAMNTGMWENPVTQENIAALKARGIKVIEPVDGELACGVKGKGRMMDPERIWEKCETMACA